MTGSCHQVMTALTACQKRFPKEQDIFCRHLHNAAGWCIFSSLCPKEVASLEDCLGTSNIRTRSPDIPRRCQERSELLAACLEGQRAAADARTAACPSKGRVQATAQPAAPPSATV